MQTYWIILSSWWLGWSVNNGESFSIRNTQKKTFLRPQRELNPWPSRIPFGRSNHWSMGDSWWALQYGRTRVTYKELVYDLAHHEFPIAPSVVGASNGILEGHWFNSHWGSENYFSEYFDLRTLLCYLLSVLYFSLYNLNVRFKFPG